MSKICKNCGRVMRDKARFCMTCGTSLLPDQPAGEVKEKAAEADIGEEIPEVSEPEAVTESVTAETEEDIGENAAELIEKEASETETAGPGKDAPETEDIGKETELDIQKRAFGYAEPRNTETEETAIPEPPEKKKIKPWIWIVAGVLVIGAAVAVLAITGVFSA